MDTCVWRLCLEVVFGGCVWRLNFQTLKKKFVEIYTLSLFIKPEAAQRSTV